MIARTGGGYLRPSLTRPGGAAEGPWSRLAAPNVLLMGGIRPCWPVLAVPNVRTDIEDHAEGVIVMSGILVGIDGSGHSARALEWAAREAAVRKAPLTVLTVQPVLAGYTGYAVAYVGD